MSYPVTLTPGHIQTITEACGALLAERRLAANVQVYELIAHLQAQVTGIDEANAAEVAEALEAFRSPKSDA